jgi:hypothetical protein
MNTMKKFVFGVFTLLLMVSFMSCEKDKNDADAAEKDLARNDASAELYFDEIGDIADEAYGIATGNLKSTDNMIRRLGPCATVTLDTTVMPRVLTIDFGEENCLCNDGKWRRGKIIVTFTGRYHQPGTVITHTMENYHVNDNHIEGTRVMSNLGPNANGQPEYSTVVNGSITFSATGVVVSWESDHLRTWIEGYDTPEWYDNVFLISGSGSHSNSNGGGYSRTITEPLRREASCSNIVSGIVETVPVNRPTRILDYGDGTCDNIATLTIGENTYIIRLP